MVNNIDAFELSDEQLETVTGGHHGHRHHGHGFHHSGSSNININPQITIVNNIQINIAIAGPGSTIYQVNNSAIVAGNYS